jgi:hypothetical protein
LELPDIGFGKIDDVMSPDAIIKYCMHGKEQQPVIVIDNFFDDPAAWIDAASKRAFAPLGPYYPGIRSQLEQNEVSACISNLPPLLHTAFGHDNYVPAESCFSLVTTPSSSLLPIQRLPHFDTFSSGRIAVLIYLNGRSDSGTAFYRQRSTGFESVDEPGYPAFAASLEQSVQQHGMPPLAYIGGDTPIYEQIARYDGIPNRAIIYRGNTLHCAEIPEDLPLTSDPAKGRLTINIFLEAC